MTALLQIRNVPEETRRALKVRAAARGESLNTFMLELIRREVARPTVGEVLARAAQRAERAEVSALDGVLADRADRAEQARRAEPRPRAS
jgi:antitoxin FitA